MATGPNFAPPLPLMQPPACRLLDPPNSPPIDPFLADRLRNHRHLAIAPALRARLIQERGGDSLSPVVFSLISFEAGTGRPRLPSPPLFVRILESAVRCGRSEASA